MAHKLTVKQVINVQRKELTSLMSGVDTCRRLNNVNWLRNEISFTESVTLFYMPRSQQKMHLDFTCISNIGKAYDYIVANMDAHIDIDEIHKIHRILRMGMVGDQRMTGNDRCHIPSEINHILYNLHNSREDVLTRAITIHHELIELQPFDDFNKRTSRLIMNWILVKNGYTPIIFNKPKDKVNYPRQLIAVFGGDKKSYRDYMLHCMARTQSDIIKVLRPTKAL